MEDIKIISLMTLTFLLTLGGVTYLRYKLRQLSKKTEEEYKKLTEHKT